MKFKAKAFNSSKILQLQEVLESDPLDDDDEAFSLDCRAKKQFKKASSSSSIEHDQPVVVTHDILKVMQSEIPVIEDIFEPDLASKNLLELNVCDEEIRKAQSLLAKISKKRTHVQPSNIENIDNLTYSPLFTIPKVQSANERIEALNSFSTNQVSDVFLEKSESNISPSGHSKIQLVTRINGKRVCKFKISPVEKFIVLYQYLGDILNIDSNSLKVKFDGDIIDVQKSPESFDMEDDTLLDLKIPDDVYARVQENLFEYK